MESRARRSFVAALVLACAAWPASACFFDWDLPAGGDGGDANPPDKNGGPPEGGAEVTFDEPPPPPPTSCVPPKCGPGTYCKANQCGSAGTCTPIPKCTNGGAAYWCGCANIYKDECALYESGDMLNDQGCKPSNPPYYQCGYLYCPPQKTACVDHIALSTYECVDLTPFGCGTPVTCACLWDSGICDGGHVGKCQDVEAGVKVICEP
jgi:hypothetical protein